MQEIRSRLHGLAVLTGITSAIIASLLTGSSIALQAALATELSAAIRLYQRGDYAQAAQLLALECQDPAGCGRAGVWLGKCYLKLRRWDEAIRELERTVDAEPSCSECHLWLGRAYGRKAERASWFAAISLAKKVGREFETATTLSPESLDARFDLLEFDLQAPGIVGGGKDKALRQVEAIERLNKRAGFTARSRLYAREEKWEAARDELTRATLEFPGEPDAFVDLAAFLMRRKDYGGAGNAAAKAVALRAGSPRARLILAASRIEQHEELMGAEASLKELAAGPLGDEDPGFEEVYYWLGVGYVAQGKNREALEAFDEALRFDPDYRDAKSAISALGTPPSEPE